MPTVREDAGAIRAGRFSFRLERTLRIPDDGRPYPLPPTFGAFPVCRLAAHRTRPRFVIPIRQWEALWISFDAPAWRPSAVQIFAGSANVLSGGSDRRLTSRPQNYIVCPHQPWLDGFHTATGRVRQFVAAPLYLGLTVAEQLGENSSSLLSIRVIPPRPGRFPDRRPRGFVSPYILESLSLEGMGLGAGGIIEQKIYPDPYGVSTWDPARSTTIEIALLNSATFGALTGRPLPPSPISASDYTRLGFPWFRLYDEDACDTEPARRMRDIRSLGLADASTPEPVIRTLRRTKRKKDE